MRWNWQRITLAIVDAFAAASALGGGYAVMAGAIKFPAEWIGGSWLINDYWVAGAILCVVTGGTSLAAFLAILFSRTVGAGFSAAAGLVMMGWILGEIAIIGEFAWLQVVYLATGLAMLGLALAVERADLRATAHRLHLA